MLGTRDFLSQFCFTVLLTGSSSFSVPVHQHPRSDANTQRAAEIVNAARYCPAVFIQASTALWLQKTAFFSARPHKKLLP